MKLGDYVEASVDLKNTIWIGVIDSDKYFTNPTEAEKNKAAPNIHNMPRVLAVIGYLPWLRCNPDFRKTNYCFFLRPMLLQNADP